MKKRVFLLLFLLMFLTNIGVVNAASKNIEVTNFKVKEKSGTVLVEAINFSNNILSSNITFNKKDDFVLFEFKVKNNESDQYKIKSIKDNNTNNNISIEYSFDTDFMPKGEYKVVTMKVTYVKQLKNVDKVSLNNLIITLNMENDKEDEIIINPTTGDAILHYLVMLIIALTGLILIIVKKRKKIGKVLMVLAIILLPLGAIAREEYKIEIKFINIDLIGEFEKFNITIDPSNGNDPIVKEVTYGDPIGELPPDPSKEGYDFEGWEDENGEEVTPDTIITGEKEVKAKYTPIKYNITYDLRDGSLPSGKENPEEYTIEDEITLVNPTKEGKTFAGWTGSNGTSLQTRVTISKGSTGNKSYTANYSENGPAMYSVTHKYQNSDLVTYEEDIENLEGAIGTTVSPSLKARTGYKTPEVQSITLGTEENSVTYIYDRESYTFVITDRTYIAEGTTEDGTYIYDTPITVIAIDRPGYDFKWSDGNKELNRTINISENIELTPIYTAKNNTPYKVEHYKQNLNDGEYSLASTQNLEGTTGSKVRPAVNTYEGFKSPLTEEVEIAGDGSTVVVYRYDREIYPFEITDRTNIDESVTTPNGEYPYGTEITIKAEVLPGYDFEWSDGNKNPERTIELTGSTSLTPVYTPKTNIAYKVEHYKMDIGGENYSLAEIENKTGTAGASITPAVKSYKGFTSPETQTTNINGDGSTVVRYDYTRNKYQVTFENPDDIVEGDLSGEYYYGEEIKVTAKDKEDSTFDGWSNGEKKKDITITVSDEDITISPIYTTSTEKTYKIIHKYAKLTGGYEEVTVSSVGTVGSTIPAPRQPKTGFVNPEEQNITITEDGKASVTYTYEREKYSFSITDRENIDSTSTEDGEYLYGTPIIIKANPVEHYTFSWSDGVTDYTRTFNLTESTTLTPVYTPITYDIVFNKNANDATGTMNKQVVSYNEETTLNENTFVRPGYTFVRWNTDSDGSGTPYEDKTPIKNLLLSGTMTLYAEWSANTNTPYKVVHKYAKVMGGYDDEVEPLTGKTDTEITPSVKPREGFITPERQTTTIKGDESTVVEYYYERETFTFTISDRTYIDETVSTPNGTYPYDYPVTLKAINRPGYDFVWSDDETEYERTINIRDSIILGLIYTARTDTPYKVIHKYAKVGEGYDEVEEPFTGTTDTSVTPSVIPRLGFITPSTQTVNIDGDGSRVVTYVYERETYPFSITDRTYIDESVSTPDGTYVYEYPIVIKAVERPGYDFKWNDDNTNYQREFDLVGEAEFTPIYTARTDTAYKVVHKYAKVMGGYDEIENEYTGTTDTSVTPSVIPRLGFITPSTQTVNIDGDGSRVVTYVYERETYPFIITDRTYIDESVTTENGTYVYEYPIVIKAIERPGYDFKWNDDNTNYEREFELVGEAEFTPIYTARTDTAYKVVHKYAKVGEGYDEVEEPFTGTTDTSVTPSVIPRTGFVSPETQTVNINGDGSTVVTYVYERITYSFSITDRTYIDESVTTENGTYVYEYPIVMKAIERPGYDFKWNDNNTNYQREFELVGEAEFTPIYTAREDTAYKVIHKKQKITLDGYEVAETEDLTGTTDTSVTPAVKNYPGFTAPATQTVNIDGDGSRVVTYEYTRNSYTLSFDNSEYVNSTKVAGSYPYETEVTISPKEKVGYTFSKWSNNETSNPYTFKILGDITITPIYTPNTNTPYKVVHRYAKVGGGYDDIEEPFTGTTDTEVTPAVIPRTGFVSPETQTVNIDGDGSRVVTYVYERLTYAFTISDRTYIDETVSTENGTYVYEYPITVKAVNRPGYDFKWSDNDTNYEKEFELNGITTLSTIYTAREDTAYKVVHKYAKVSSGYDEEEEPFTGKTDTSVTPAVKPRTGFTSPSTQTVNINGDGSTVVTYVYERLTYSFSIEDRKYIDETSSTPNGSYVYEYPITVKAVNRPGYDFKWSDDDTNYQKTFDLTGITTLSTIYTARTDTAYTVLHMTQKLDGTYEQREKEELTGTTDTSVTPSVKTYTGFTSPSTQTVNIDGDGSRVVTYNYTRNKYQLTIETPEYVEEDKSGSYYYQEQVSIKAIDRAGYTFAGWSTGETTKEITITMGTSAITTKPLYTANTDTVYKVKHRYAKLTSGYDEVEISHTGETDKTVEAPLRPQTGFVNPTVQTVKIKGDGTASVTYTYARETYSFSITDRTNLVSGSTANGTYPYGTEISLTAKEISGYSFKWSDNNTSYSRTFPLEGATTLSLVYTANNYTVTANGNGGSIKTTTGWTGSGETATKSVTYDQTYGTLPDAERTGYTLAGYNTASNGSGTNITSTTKVQTASNHPIYAIWIGNDLVFNAETRNVTFSTASQTINVTPATNGTGTYTYEKTSGDSGISVSSTGVITISANLGVGNHDVYIKATDSNSGSNKTAKYTVAIGQKKATVTLGTTPTVTYGTNSTMTYTYDGDGTVTCASSDTTAVTCSVNTSTKVITLTPVKATTSNVTITVSAGAGNNYSAADNKTATIAGVARQGIAFPTCSSKVYNASNQSLFAAHTSGTYTNNEITGTDVGNYVGSLTPTANYQWNSGSNVTSARALTCSITQAETTTSASAVSKTYNGSAITGSGSSVLKNTSIAAPSAAYTYTYYNGSSCSGTALTSAPINWRDGGYSYKATLTGTTNYATSTSGCATLTINKKKATVTLGTTPTMTYGSNSTMTYTYDGDGTVTCASSDTTAVTCSVNTSTKVITLTPVKATTSNVTITVSAGAGNNYSAADNKTATIAGVARQGIAFPTCSSKVYNASNQSLFAAHTSGTYTNNEITGTDVGNYVGSLTPTANYQWNSGSNVTSARALTCSITQAETTTSASAVSKTYNGSAITGSGSSVLKNTSIAAPSAAYTYTYYNGSSCSGTALTSAPTDWRDGGYSYKATLTGTTNYATSTSECATLTINKKKGTITLGTTPTVTYGTDSTLTYTYDGDGTVSCASSDTSAVTCSVDATNKKITLHPLKATSNNVTITVSAGAGNNYSAADNKTATVTVGKKKATITLGTTPTITYGTDSTLTYTYDGDGTVSCASSDTSAVTCSVDATNKKITLHPLKATSNNVTITVSAGAGNNYSAADNKTATLTINKKKATITLGTTPTMTYGTNSTMTYTYDGDGTVTCASSDTSAVTCSVNTSTKVITLTPVKATTSNVTITVSAGAGNNYSAADNKTATIAGVARQGIAFPTCSSKVYNASNQSLFAAHTSGTYTNNEITGTDVGNYVGSLTPTANYQWNSGSNVTSARALTCSITQAETTTSASAVSKTYNGSAITGSGSSVLKNTSIAAPSAAYTYTYYNGSSCSGTALTSAPTDWRDGGYSYKATLTGTTNYATSTSECATLTINKKKGTITLGTTPTVTYGTDSTLTYTYDGDGTVSCASSDTSAVTCSVDATNKKITLHPLKATSNNVTITVSAGAGNNYSAADNKTATVTVGKKKATITPSASTKVLTYPTADTVTYTYDGDGTVSCASSDATYVTCSVNTSTKTVTLTPVKPTSTAVTVTLSSTAGNNYSAADNKTVSVTVGKGTCNAPTNVTIGTDKKVGWTNSSNASSYQISMSASSGFAAHTNGAAYNSITASTGTRTVYVRSVCDTTYYNQYSSNASKSTTVYSVTLTKGTGIATVSGAGNYITGYTVTLGATVSDGYAWSNWTQTSGGSQVSTTNAYSAVITGNWAYTANGIESTATFNDGSTVNNRMHELAQLSNPDSTFGPFSINSVSKSDVKPSSSILIPENIVSTIDSNCPIYMWYDNGTIYWWSEAETIYLNPDSSSMFEYLPFTTSIDISDFNTSKVTNMSKMFKDCGVSGLDLSSFDTSHVTDMSHMFDNCNSLTNLDVTKFNTSNVTDMSYMFDNCINLASLDVTKFTTTNVTDMSHMFEACNSLTNLDVTKFNTSNVTNMSYMFDNCRSLTSLDVTKFNTSNVTNMSYMFRNCNSLTSLDVTKFNTSNVTDMSYMFNSCRSLTSLDVTKFNTEKVTTMSGMFWYCESLTTIDVTHFNTSNVTDMSMMFTQASSLTSLDVTGFDTSKVTTMWSMFANCRSLTTIDVTHFITNNVIEMQAMFSGCSGLTSLDVTHFNTSNVTDMGAMFYNCSGLTSLDVSNFDTSNVTNMLNMFFNCRNLTSIDVSNFNTSNVTTMESMFANCSSVTTIDVSSFDTSNVTDMEMMFNSCTNLTTIYASNTFVTTNVTQHNSMFYSSRNLIGGAGTTYNSSYTNKEYAHIDGGTSNPGYFTEKKVAQFTYGTFVNRNMKRLAGDSSATYNTNNTTITSITKSTSQPSSSILTENSIVSSDESPFPIYMWFDNGTIYWWSEANFIYLHESSINMFAGLKGLTNIDVSSFDTRYAKDIGGMFWGDSSLVTLDLSSFNTKNVTSMSGLFGGCTSLTNLDISSFDTSKVWSMSQMFAYCSSLTTIDVTHFDTSNVTDINHMFERMTSITSLDLSSFDTSKVYNMSGLFIYDSNLTTIYVSDSFVTTDLDSSGGYYMFDDCNSLVGGSGTTYNSSYTNQTYAHIDGGTSNPGYFTRKQ